MIKNLKIKALKDKDFLDLQSKSNENLINISKENAITLFTTIKEDLNLLSKANLMDYSLFIAVAKKEDEKNESIFLIKVYSTDGKYCYYISVIDFLTDYTIRKKFENAYKNIFKKRKNKNTFSAVEPVRYQKRFYNFLKQNIIFYEGRESRVSLL